MTFEVRYEATNTEDGAPVTSQHITWIATAGKKFLTREGAKRRIKETNQSSEISILSVSKVAS